MQAAVHEIGPPGDGATISDGGVAVLDHSNILAILSSSSLAIFSASSVVPGRDADDVVVVTTTNIKIASFSKGMSTPLCRAGLMEPRHRLLLMGPFIHSSSGVFQHLDCGIRSLKQLDISMNGLQGDIPGDGIGNSTQLVHLDMSLNRFNGSIPYQIFRLTLQQKKDFGSTYSTQKNKSNRP
ncbi:leucine-rich repeat-containing protein [Tanacetum coccineum]